MNSDYIMNTYSPSDLTFESGEGSWLFEKNGEKYLDFASGIAVNSVGHCHPHLVAEIQRQASKLIHTSNLYNISQQERLAKRLCNLSFTGSVFFANSGAEANEGAVKVARRYMYESGKPERNVILCIEGCFHGRTLSMLSATSKVENRLGFGPLPDGFRHVGFNDIESLESHCSSDDIAAIMIEPVLGEGGAKSVSKKFFLKVQELAVKNKFLIISDEVQTGIGRLGTLFGYQNTELKPDIMAIAKGLGGGVPIGAILATKNVSSAMKPGSHGSTFGGNPLVTASANAVLDILTEKFFFKKLNEKIDFLTLKLNELKKDFPNFVLEIRGQGFLRGIKLKDPVNDVQNELKKNKVLFVPAAENVLRLLPPLTVKKEEIELAIEALRKEANRRSIL
ncbi:MAG: acetylornithine transaminase [SAR116 cluster bacterium]|nr:acetylornithine transaminase [SAR116 cluster bacterium]